MSSSLCSNAFCRSATANLLSSYMLSTSLCSRLFHDRPSFPRCRNSEISSPNYTRPEPIFSRRTYVTHRSSMISTERATSNVSIPSKRNDHQGNTAGYATARLESASRSAEVCSGRIVRGGDWFSTEASLRPAVRARADADAHNDDIGFRVARTLAPWGPERNSTLGAVLNHQLVMAGQKREDALRASARASTRVWRTLSWLKLVSWACTHKSGDGASGLLIGFSPENRHRPDGSACPLKCQ